MDGLSDIVTIGDYVLATKYPDGDPKDHFAIGFYHNALTNYNPVRHIVVDSNGVVFRQNGFRRVKKISRRRGAFLVANIEAIEVGSKSVWWWARCSMKAESSP